MKVVTSAISTIIANSAGEITPMSRPTLSTTSSMSPRVFISVPIAQESRHDIPLVRAASAEPPSLPKTATAMMSAQ